MATVYRSKVDAWLVAVIIIVIVVPVILLMPPDFSWKIVLIVGGMLAFMLYCIFSISYVVSDTMLIVKNGVFGNEKYDVKSICKIENTRTILSAPAASLDRIAIYFDDKVTVLVISPRHKEAFINKLLEINPNIRYGV